MAEVALEIISGMARAASSPTMWSCNGSHPACSMLISPTWCRHVLRIPQAIGAGSILDRLPAYRLMLPLDSHAGRVVCHWIRRCLRGGGRVLLPSSSGNSRMCRSQSQWLGRRCPTLSQPCTHGSSLLLHDSMAGSAVWQDLWLRPGREGCISMALRHNHQIASLPKLLRFMMTARTMHAGLHALSACVFQRRPGGGWGPLQAEGSGVRTR